MTALQQTFSCRSLLVLLSGPVCAVLFIFLATVSSPFFAVALLLGVGVMAAMFVRPFFAFLLTAFVVPLERMGRFTDDSAVYSISLMKVLGVLALASMLVHWLLGRRRLQFPLPIALYSAYLALALFTLTYTSDFTNGVRAISLIGGNFLFFFLVTNVVEGRRQAETAIRCWLLSTLLVGLVTIYQFHNPAALVDNPEYYKGPGELTTENRFDVVIYDSLLDSPERSKRAIGTTSHPAVYAINLILALPFFVYFFRVAPKPWMRYASAFGGLVVCYNIFLANTRAAILTLVMVLSLFFLTGLLRLRIRVIAGVALLAVIILIGNPSDIWQRALNFGTYSVTVNVVEERVLMWKAAVEVISDHWFTGTGIGNIKEVPQRVKVPVASFSAHNDVLMLLVETGIFGFLVMIVFLICLHQQCRFLERFFQQQGDFAASLLPVAARVGLYAVLFYGTQVEALTFPLKGFWLSMGLVVALSERAIQPARQAPVAFPQLSLSRTRMIEP
jgi:hypothetical protein